MQNNYQALTEFMVLVVGFLYVMLFMFLKESLIKEYNILSLLKIKLFSQNYLAYIMYEVLTTIQNLEYFDRKHSNVCKYLSNGTQFFTC